MHALFSRNLFQLLFLLAALFLLSCEAKEGRPVADMASYESIPITGQPPLPQAVPDRKLIKEADLIYQTTDLKKAGKRILEATKKYQGYLAGEQVESLNDRIRQRIKVRVPVRQFDSFLAEATQGVEQFERKDIEVKDVTEEFLDVEARIATKKALEQRYLALLDKADKVSEMLEIERELGQLRTDIESVEGRLIYLQNQTSFATVRFTVYQPLPTRMAFAGKFSKGFQNGWENLIWFFIMLINIWPFLLIIILVLLLLYFRKRFKAVS